mmetsp:Transcript_44846/g.100767  ORF Transcript_44846/g.100767 Transcript_44846/m.100767 type:complete len:892 (-) Transcript_44846:111-2786(-)
MKPESAYWQEHLRGNATSSGEALDADSVMLFVCIACFVAGITVQILYHRFTGQKQSGLQTTEREVVHEVHSRRPLLRDELLNSLLELSDDDLQWIMTKVADAKGTSLQRPHKLRASSVLKLADTLTLPKMDTSFSRSGQRTQTIDTQPLVQFASYHSYVEEGKEIALRVIRWGGNLSGRSEVFYSTQDSSARSGVHYGVQAGKLVFEPREWEKVVTVPLLDNDQYGPSLEFKVILHEEGLVNALLSSSLQTTWVEIIDNDGFPTNRHKEAIQKGELGTLSLTGLLIEYLRFALMDPSIMKGTVRLVLTDQCFNLYGFINLFLMVYIVDFIVQKSRPAEHLFLVHDRTASLCLVTACMVLPFAALHILEYTKHFLGVSGTARATLQTALLRKFLDFSQDVRSDLQNGDLIMATTHDAFDLVEKGLLKMFCFFKLLGTLVSLITFQFLAPWVFNRPFRLWVVALIISFPALMFLIAHLRFKVCEKWLSAVHDSEASLAAHVHETVVNYRLIADYNQRPIFVEKYNQLVQENNEVTATTACVLTNNHFAVQWLATLGVAGFTFYGGLLVISGSMTLGIFLANIRILTTVGDVSGDVYMTWLEVQKVFPALLRLTRLLNASIDVVERKQMADFGQKLTSDCLPGLASPDGIELNALPLMLDRIKVTLSQDVVAQFHGRVDIHQGHFVAIIGPRGAGTSTLVKIMGSALQPDEPGGIFIPSHLRTVLVQYDPMFFSGTLMENLTFGIRHKEGGEGSRDRVLGISKMIGVSDKLLSYIESDETHPWVSALSTTEKVLLSWARAFIANPDVLILDKGLEVFDQVKKTQLLGLIKTFIDDRGLCIDNKRALWEHRTPRTVVLSTSEPFVIDQADEVISITPDGAMLKVDKADIKADFLA